MRGIYTNEIGAPVRIGSTVNTDFAIKSSGGGTRYLSTYLSKLYSFNSGLLFPLNSDVLSFND